MVEKIKLLLGEDLDDVLVQIYIDRAAATILNYLNNPRLTEEYILENYEDAVLLLVENAYSMKDKRFVKSYSQGKRSVHYFDDFANTIPGDVKSLLPSPYIRLR